MTALYDIVQLSKFKRRSYLADYSTASLAIMKKGVQICNSVLFIYRDPVIGRRKTNTQDSEKSYVKEEKSEVKHDCKV